MSFLCVNVIHYLERRQTPDLKHLLFLINYDRNRSESSIQENCARKQDETDVLARFQTRKYPVPWTRFEPDTQVRRVTATPHFHGTGGMCYNWRHKMLLYTVL